MSELGSDYFSTEPSAETPTLAHTFTEAIGETLKWRAQLRISHINFEVMNRCYFKGQNFGNDLLSNNR